jgi:signal transduction histidine kinase
MADDAPLPDPVATGRPRFAWPRGLSSRLLLLTALLVVIADAIIVPAILATRQREWLGDRVAAGELASLVVQAAPQGKVTDQLKEKILRSAGVTAVTITGEGGVMRAVLAPSRGQRSNYVIDLRRQDPLAFLSAPLETLFGGGDRMVLVIDRPHYQAGQLVRIQVPDRALRAILLADLGELLIGAVIASAVVGGGVYLLLDFLLVRPILRITNALERFRADPNDPASSLKPSGRHDEIGRAEAELDRMQSDLRAALASRSRLAALGEAVAKINHEMRNMLTSAQMASERLAASGDPVVARTLPRLGRALDRAVTLATNVLAFGRTEEPTPELKLTPLREVVDAAAEDAQLAQAGVELVNEVDESRQVLADPDQLHRLLVNLMRNAREAIQSDADERREGVVTVAFSADGGESVIRIADNGPGLPERAQSNLFQPFSGSARRGGAGLGLVISRELAQAHGGDLSLVETGPSGTTFELRLRAGPEPMDEPGDCRTATRDLQSPREQPEQ